MAKAKQSILIAAILFNCVNTFAISLPAASIKCPFPPALQCIPAPDTDDMAKTRTISTGLWKATNAEGKTFSSSKNYPCSFKINVLIPALTEVNDNYQIKCVYDAEQSTGAKYQVALYNEDYKLCPDSSIIDVKEKCPDKK